MNRAKFVTVSNACPPLHSRLTSHALTHCPSFAAAAATCLGSSICLQLCFSICISLAPIILSSGHQILVNAKCRGSPSSVPLGYVESLKLEPSEAKSLLCVLNFPGVKGKAPQYFQSFASLVHLESPYAFSGHLPNLFWLAASTSVQVLLLFVCSSLNF